VTQFLANLVADYGYVAVFLLMTASTACIPVPSEVVLVFGGALASAQFAATALGDPSAQLNLAWVIVVATVGTLAGSWIAYGIGFAGGRALVDRAGRYLLFRPEEVDRAHEWFERRGDLAVLVCRVIPVARAFISLPAGVARMNPWRFTLYTLIGALTWDVGLAVAGYYLGESWRVVETYIRPIAIVVAVALVAVVAWWVMRRVRARRAIGEGAVTPPGPATPPAEAPTDTPRRDR
jgi:membrane protein DedA with SNARE-associated domain